MTKQDEPTQGVKDTVRVRSHERKLPDKSAHSKQQDEPRQPQGTQGVVEVSKSKLEGGVTRLSRREPGALETTVEIGVDQNKRDKTGRRVFD